MTQDTSFFSWILSLFACLLFEALLTDLHAVQKLSERDLKFNTFAQLNNLWIVTSVVFSSVSHSVKISFKTHGEIFLVLVSLLIPYKCSDILLHHIHKSLIFWLENRCCWEGLSILGVLCCQKYNGTTLSLKKTWFPPK